MSAPTTFFQFLRLGDDNAEPAALKIDAQIPDFRAGTGAERASAFAAGAGASIEASVRVYFTRVGAETVIAFGRRVRAWMASFITALGNTFGPLSIVRDLDGTEWGTADENTMSAAHAAGTDPIVFTSVPSGWVVNDYVLLVNVAAPTTGYEVAKITAKTSTTITIGAGTVFGYAINSKVYRVLWHLPDSHPVTMPELPSDDNVDPNDFIEVSVVFRSTRDPIESAYTS